jgi:glucosamine kinase
MTARVLGLDSGGTKTVAVVVDPTGHVLSYDSGAGLDPNAGPDWEKRLKAFADRLGPADAAVLGLPCHGEMPDVSARQIDVATALFGARTEVLNDVAVAFEAAFGGGDGVLILAGTGSMAWAQGPSGTVRVGGWGDAFGDEGSAHWIGREALAAISRHLDGRQPHPAFAHGLLTRLGLQDDGLMAWTYGHANPRAAIAGVAREVSALADAEVAEAVSILQAAARHLAEQGRTAACLSGARSPLRWALSGSVTRDPTLCAALCAAMGCAPVPARLPSVGGAVLRAARAAGWTVADPFIDRLASGLSDLSRSRTES